VPEAARHLSILFEEEISEADVLSLALDGLLRLSVLFVNRAFACCGQIITERHYFEDRPGRVILGFDEALQHDERIQCMYGVWDLMMRGAEKDHVEREWQKLTDGPAVKDEYGEACAFEPRK
jgi:hypothetical protein